MALAAASKLVMRKTFWEMEECSMDIQLVPTNACNDYQLRPRSASTPSEFVFESCFHGFELASTNGSCEDSDGSVSRDEISTDGDTSWSAMMEEEADFHEPSLPDSPPGVFAAPACALSAVSAKHGLGKGSPTEMAQDKADEISALSGPPGTFTQPMQPMCYVVAVLM